MKFIEKTKEFGKKHKKKLIGAGFVAAGASIGAVAYCLGIKEAHGVWSTLANAAAFEGKDIILTHAPTGDRYKMIMEKVVEEVVEE
jgi:hypothetical protein